MKRQNCILPAPTLHCDLRSKIFSCTIRALSLSFLGLSGFSQAAVLTNDTYEVVPAADFGAGFGFIVSGYSGPFTFDGTPETLGTDFTGGTITISESEVDNGNSTSTISIELNTTGSDIFPSMDGGGGAITAAAWFMGASLGGDNLEFEGGSPTLAGSGVQIFGFNSSGANLWGFNLFTSGVTWDGSGGFNLGTTPLGQGTTRIILTIDVQNPANLPASLSSPSGLPASLPVASVRKRLRPFRITRSAGELPPADLLHTKRPQESYPSLQAGASLLCFSNKP